MTRERNASWSSLRVRLTRRSGAAAEAPDFRTTCRPCSVLDIAPPLVVDGSTAPSVGLNTMFRNILRVQQTINDEGDSDGNHSGVGDRRNGQDRRRGRRPAVGEGYDDQGVGAS